MGYLRDEGFVDGIVDVTRLNEEFVGQNGVVRSVVVPALLVDASGRHVTVEGFLEGDEPVAEEAQPEFRKTAVVVLDDLGDAREGVVVLVQQPVNPKHQSRQHCHQINDVISRNIEENEGISRNIEENEGISRKMKENEGK